METLIDQAARLLGLDPVQMRLRNLIDASAMPYRTPTGETLDSGDFPQLLRLACERFGYDQERERQRLKSTGNSNSPPPPANARGSGASSLTTFPTGEP
jgi:carbon-monoxide dehydrogenase large subunit